MPEHVNEKAKIRNKLVDYFDRKLTQQFIGTQLIELMQEYCDEALCDLPEHVKEEAKIRNINKRCARAKEDQLSRKKKALADSRRERLEESRGPVNMELIEQAGRRAVTINSRDWRMQDQRGEMELIGKMLVKGYFGNLKAIDFKIELFRVIPSFKTDLTWQANKSKIMKGDKSATDLGAYLSN